MSPFVDRKEELRALKERLTGEDFELITICGRKRVGKPRLVLEAVKYLPHVYYLAVEGDNLRHFRETAERVFPEVRCSREDWGTLHTLKGKILVIDEFPNRIKENPQVLSLLQRAIDLDLSNSTTKLVLLGSL